MHIHNWVQQTQIEPAKKYAQHNFFSIYNLHQDNHTHYICHFFSNSNFQLNFFLYTKCRSFLLKYTISPHNWKCMTQPRLPNPLFLSQAGTPYWSVIGVPCLTWSWPISVFSLLISAISVCLYQLCERWVPHIAGHGRSVSSSIRGLTRVKVLFIVRTFSTVVTADWIYGRFLQKLARLVFDRSCFHGG